MKRLKKIKMEKNHLTAVISIILFAVFSGVFINYLSKEIKFGVLVALLVLSGCLITLFLTNQLYKKMYKKLVEKGRECIGEFQVNDYEKKNFAVMDEITEKYARINHSVEDLKESIKVQTESVEDTSESFNNITDAVFSISKEINDVNISLDEMKNDKDEVIKLIEETAMFAKQTVSASEEFSSVVAYHVQTVSDIIEAIQGTKNKLTDIIND